MLAPCPHRLPLERYRGLQRQDVVDEELQAALTLVFVDVEAVNELHVAFRRDEAIAFFDVVERNCIERTPCSWDFDPHFQVTVADDTGIPDGKNTVETRLGKGLAPRAASSRRC